MRFVALVALAASTIGYAQTAPTSAPATDTAPPISAPASARVAAPASSPAADSTPIVSAPADALPAFDENAVYLFNGEKFMRLDKTPYAVATRYIFVTVLLLMKIPGSNSDARVKPGMKPFLLIGGSTKGGQLVHLSVETAHNDPHRETRFVGEGQITNSDLIRYQEEKLPSGWHKITPYINKPGEYAWVPFVGTHIDIVYDFGIEK